MQNWNIILTHATSGCISVNPNTVILLCVTLANLLTLFMPSFLTYQMMIRIIPISHRLLCCSGVNSI